MKVLKLLWKKWRAFGKLIGDFVARIFMTVFYFSIAVPFGLGMRLFKDPLRLRSSTPHWLEREEPEPTIEGARRLY